MALPKTKDNENKAVKNDFRLPAILAADITSSNFDLMLIFLYWLYKLNLANKNNLLNEKNNPHLLGALTALTWFPGGASLIKLRDKLMELEKDSGDYLKFWNQDLIKQLFIQEQGKSVLLPLLPPEKLEQILEEPLKPILKDEIEKEYRKKGYEWPWSLYGTDKKLNSDAIEWIAGKIREEGTQDEEDSARELAKRLWWDLWDSIYHDKHRRLVCYAQRHFLHNNYDWFDPTQPRKIQDRNRPWDYDHILPHSWSHVTKNIKSNIPHIVRMWIKASGNFRAWPMEANRSKGANQILEDKLPSYGLKDEKDVAEASYVKNLNEWKDLEKAIKVNGKLQFDRPGEHHGLFIKLAMKRTVQLYEEWYTNLGIKDLVEQSSEGTP